MKTTTALAIALVLLAPSAYAVNGSSVNDSNVVDGVNSGVITQNIGPGSGATTLAPAATATTGPVTVAPTIAPVNTNIAGVDVDNRIDNRDITTVTPVQVSEQEAQLDAKTGDQKVEIQAQKRNPVSTAYSGPLVAADDTCMGSSSAGAQGIGFGVSLGSTWTDENCVRRKDARELHNMGYQPAAIALLCQSPQVAKAMAAAGTPCASDSVVAESDETAEWWDRSDYPTNGSRNR